jgi:hypothetical protein
MSQGNRILSEVTRLGSSLTELATSELDTVLNQIRGPQGDASPSLDSGEANVGTLAVNAMQLLGKVGDLITQLSKYDLVRKDAPSLALGTASPISSFTVPNGKEREYVFLLENNDGKPKYVTVDARLAALPRSDGGASPDTKALEVSEDVRHFEILPEERRRIQVTIPAQYETGKYKLSIDVTARDDKGTTTTRKTVVLTVLPSVG